jgi:4-amino-4-deoxy-L-arabinose transferase-like glycosyltransferase
VSQAPPRHPWWRKEGVWAPALAFLVASTLLFTALGSYGLWDPQEIEVADKAQRALADGKLIEIVRTTPPMNYWLVGWSVSIFGTSELAARLPLALVGLLGALATYALGARLRRPRAGAIAAIVLVSSPLYLFQARQVAGEIGLPAGIAIAALGLSGLVWPGARVRAPALLRDGLLALVGLGLASLSSGVLFGAFFPLATAAAASFATLRARDDEAPPSEYRWVLSSVFALGAGVVLAVVLEQLYSIVPAQPGQLAILGKTLKADPQYEMLLGGTWRQVPVDKGITFAESVSQVAFGMFPWSAAAPVAVFWLLRRTSSSRRDFAGTFVFFGCLIAFLLSAIWVQKVVVPIGFPALSLIAVAVALWLDDLIAAKLEGDERAAPDASEGLPVAALFVFLAAAILALDLRNFPVELASVHLDGQQIAFPPEPFLRVAPIAFGLIFGGLVAVALVVQTPSQRPAARVGLFGAVAAGAALGLFLSVVYLPVLSRHLSYKNVFEAYKRYRRGDEPLGVMGIPGKGPDFYSPTTLAQLREVPDVVKFLRRDIRSFVILPSDRLCSVHELSVGGNLTYHVLDDENSRYMLITNKMMPNEQDKNPLADIFRAEPPAKFARDVKANFDDTIELLGIDMPEGVKKGQKFKVTLWLRVLKRPSEDWKVFLHFDQGAIRFIGDHPPARCGMKTWQPGDIIADTFEIKAAPEITQPRGMYAVWGGFFKGSGGVWYNMPVKTEPHDPKDRVPFGTFRVE